MTRVHNPSRGRARPEGLFSKRLASAATIVAVVALGACGSSSSSSTATATASSKSASSTPAVVVPQVDPSAPDGAGAATDIIFPPQGTTCGPPKVFSGCPLTFRLQARLVGLAKQSKGNLNPLCRCSSDWVKREVSIAKTPTGGVVTVSLIFNSGAPAHLDLAVLKSTSGWVGDDITCTGKGPPTSVYVDSPPPCT